MYRLFLHCSDAHQCHDGNGVIFFAVDNRSQTRVIANAEKVALIAGLLRYI